MLTIARIRRSKQLLATAPRFFSTAAKTTSIFESADFLKDEDTTTKVVESSG